MRFEKLEPSFLIDGYRCYRHTSDDGNVFEIVVTKQGISFQGMSPVIGHREDLDAFAQVVSLAYQDYHRFRPKLVS